MAWGARSNVGIEDLVARVAADDPTLTALALLPSRKFGDAEASALAAALSSNTTLRELHVGGRQLSAESARVLAQALVQRAEIGSGVVALRALSVGDATFGCGGTSALAPMLSRRGVLCGELDLEFRGVGVEGARALSGAIAEARRSEAERRRRQGKEVKRDRQRQALFFVQSLNLARNPSLGDAGAEALSEALFGGLDDDGEGEDETKVLTSLDLSECGLSSDGVASLLSDRRESPSSSPLVSLRLERNAALCFRAAESLAEALEARKLSDLERLSLSGCGSVGDVGASALARALSSPSPSRKLRSLDLSGCGVGEEGARALAEAIGSSAGCCMSVLRLGGGGTEGKTKRIGNAGAAALGLALSSSSSTSLKELDLSSSGITSGEAVASLLSPGSSSLESLTLAGNVLGDEGAFAVAAALLKSSSSKLQHLDLAACGIGLRGAVALADALLLERSGEDGEEKEPSFAATRDLRTLVLGGNPATEEGGDAFATDVVARLREARPELDVAWRSADQHAAAERK